MGRRGLDFVFNLVDRVSGPARHVQNAWQRIAQHTRNAGNRVNQASASMARAMERPTFAGRVLASTFRGIGLASRSLDTARMRAAALTTSIGALRSIALAVPMIVAGGAVGKAAGTAISEVSGKENTMIAFELLTGGPEAARQMWDDVMAFAELTPFETDTVTQAWKELAIAGYGALDIPVVLSGIGDLAAMNNLDEQVIGQVTNLFSRIASRGYLSRMAFDTFETILPAEAMTAALAEALNVDPSDIDSMISNRQIDAQTAAWGILEAVRRQYSGGLEDGVLGSAMQRYATSLSGLWSFVTSRPGDVLRDAFEGFDDDGNAIELAGFASLRKFLSNVVEATDTETEIGMAVGERVRGLFSDLLDGIFAPLAAATQPAMIQANIERLFDSIENGMDWIRTNGPPVMAVLREFFTGFMTGATWVATAVTWLINRVRAFGEGLTNLLGLNADGLGSFANVAGAVIGVAVAFRILNAITLGFARTFLVTAGRIALGWIIAMGPIGWIILAVGALVAAIVWAYNKFDWFRDLVDGVWEAIKTASITAWNAISSTATNTWEAIKSIPDSIKASFAGLWDDFKQATQEVWADILSFIQPAIDAFQGFLATVDGWLGGKKNPVVTLPEGADDILRDSTAHGIAAAVPLTAATGGVEAGSTAAAALSLADPRVMPIWAATAPFDQDITSQLAAGWAAGIYASENEVLRAFEDLSGRTISLVEGAYEIRSPSRVFMRLGNQVGAGFIAGITSTYSAIDRAMNGITDQTVDSTAVVPLVTTSTTAAGQLVTIERIDITIRLEGGDDPEEAGRAAADAFVDQLTDALEDLATAEGA